jgi:hypothetical protein
MHQSKTACLLLCASDGELEGHNNSRSRPGPSVSFDASATASDQPGSPTFFVDFREIASTPSRRRRLSSPVSGGGRPTLCRCVAIARICGLAWCTPRSFNFSRLGGTASHRDS